MPLPVPAIRTHAVRARAGLLPVTALVAVGAAALLTAGCGTKSAVATGKPTASATASAPAASPVPSSTAGAAGGGSGGAGGSVAGLPGQLYYVDHDRVLRLAQGGPVAVLSTGGWSASVAPDGTAIAFVDQNADVVVTDRNGQHARTVLRGSVGAGYEPAWSADSRRLLTVKSTGGGHVQYGVVDVASGTFAPLAHQLPDAIHPMWSAGGRIGYATGTCQLGTADADGGNARIVPGFGGRGRRSCDPYSISADGNLMAVHQRTGDEPDGDIGRDLYANAVVDTRTGADVALPVTGSVSAVAFEPGGDILMRTTDGRLTLLNPDRTVKAHGTEPAPVRGDWLLAVTAG
jgi:TolB protein